MLCVRYRGLSFPLNNDETTIGRSAYCSIIIDNPATSREHALLSWKGSRLTLQDLDSRNGVVLNGEKLTEQTIVQEGDVIKIGNEELLLDTYDPSSPQPTLEGRAFSTFRGSDS